MQGIAWTFLNLYILTMFFLIVRLNTSYRDTRFYGIATEEKSGQWLDFVTLKPLSAGIIKLA